MSGGGRGGMHGGVHMGGRGAGGVGHRMMTACVRGGGKGLGVHGGVRIGGIVWGGGREGRKSRVANTGTVLT